MNTNALSFIMLIIALLTRSNEPSALFHYDATSNQQNLTALLCNTVNALRNGRNVRDFKSEIGAIVMQAQNGDSNDSVDRITPTRLHFPGSDSEETRLKLGRSHFGIDVVRKLQGKAPGYSPRRNRVDVSLFSDLARLIVVAQDTENALPEEESKDIHFGSQEAMDDSEVDYEALGCGVKNENAVQARILGGEVAGYGEWPWQVALVRVATGRPFCGASLINMQFLITAGHCAILLSPRNVQAWLGTHIVSNPREKHRVIRGISLVIVHEEFKRHNLRNDIALMRMDEPVKFQFNIRPLCLPDVQEWDETLFNGTDKRLGVVAGWGLTKEKGQRSPVLLQVKIPFLGVPQCQEIYKRINPVTEKMLCTLAGNGSTGDSCKGDSGGPLVVPGAEGRWTQVGVVSFGYGCGREGYPGVYTRITQYLLWIYLKIIQTEIAMLS